MTAQPDEQNVSSVLSSKAPSVLQGLLQTIDLNSQQKDKQKTLLYALQVLLKAHFKDLSQQPVDGFLASILIAEIDQAIKQQIDEILHHPVFQSLESAWRSLHLLVEQTNFKENIKIELLNLSQSDLLEDLQDAPEIVKSGLYKLVYSQEYGQYGGEPYGVMIGNYQLTPKGSDIKLLQKVASIGAMSHTPFIAGTHSDFFAIDEMQQFPAIVDLHDVFSSPKFQKWNRFRKTEDARYIG
ncbi:MAG: type VI secretion system contractile sheath large subunit, partial [Gammaproteobacteria bacterium]|nr:type VI secretion system contractile sheath large subunit [Gammaproteobacteria bacterium]